MRTNLSTEDLGDFLDQPLLAVLATLRANGTVALSPLCHEWRDDGFNIWVRADAFKAQHLRRDPRASIVVAESVPPMRGVEVRGRARFIADDVTETAQRIMSRYIGENAAAYVETYRGTDVIIRIEPGALRIWDLADAPAERI